MKSMLDSDNFLVKRIANRVLKSENSTWNKNLREYMKEIDMRDEDWRSMSKEDIKQKVRDYDNKRWKESLETKTTLEVYKKYKKKICEEICYDNTRDSELLFRARANVLGLEDLRRHSTENLDCKICDIKEKEDLGHFLFRCSKLEKVRDRELFTQGTEVDRIGRLLFEEKNLERVKRMLGKMWKAREYHKKICEGREAR